jgi:hypothetical protein
VAERTGARVEQVDVRVALSEDDLTQGLAVDHELSAVLRRDGLAHWAAAESGAETAAGAGAVPTRGEA